MSEAILSEIFRKSLTGVHSHNQIEYLWHAGEPLTAGLAFYEKAVEFQKKHNINAVQITNSIQTNGTLIDQAWVDFFKSNDFHVGVSIDGPQFINDRNRLSWGLKSTFQSTLQGINILQNNKVPFGVVSVLTDFSLDYPDEMYEFYRENKIASLAFNIEEAENVNLVSSLKKVDEHYIIAKYKRFINRFYYLCNRDNVVKLREFNDAKIAIKKRLNNINYVRTTLETTDGAILSVSKDGNITPYSPEFSGSKSSEYENFIIGNILSSDIEQLYHSEIYNKIKDAVKKSQMRCAHECKFYALCGGGSFSNKYSEHQTLDVSETLTCKLHIKSLNEIVIENLNRTSLNPLS